MKTLIVYPQDPTTTFLKGIYEPLTSKTVITGGVTISELRNMILNHDRIMILGHGSPSDLFGVGQFPDTYIIDDSMAECLRGSEGIVSACHANTGIF